MSVFTNLLRGRGIISPPPVRPALVNSRVFSQKKTLPISPHPIARVFNNYDAEKIGAIRLARGNITTRPLVVRHPGDLFTHVARAVLNFHRSATATDRGAGNSAHFQKLRRFGIQ